MARDFKLIIKIGSSIHKMSLVSLMDINGMKANHTFIFCLYLLKQIIIYCHSCVMFLMRSMSICNN